MKHDLLAIAADLSNAALLARLQLLAARAREDTVELVAHLAEVERRRLFLAEGYGSLFDYCRIALRLSEHAAYNRTVAARVARQFPAVLGGLSDGSLNLTTVRLLAAHLTLENHGDVLARAAGRSKREVEALVTTLAPQPDVRSSIRKMPATEASVPEAPTQLQGLSSEMNASPADANARPADAVSPIAPMPAAQVATRRPVVTPLAPARYKVQFTVGSETYEDLRLAQDLFRREIPSGDPGAIFARALKLLLADAAKRKMAATLAPGAARPASPGSRHVPASVKRAVWLRDGGQCAFLARVGRRCGERAFLELHHLQPFAMGGQATVANISLRCRRHNAYEAELDFGSCLATAAGSPRPRTR